MCITGLLTSLLDTVQSWTWIGFIHGLDWIGLDWIGFNFLLKIWIGLDWVRSFVRFIVYKKTEAPSSSVFFR